MNEVANDSLSCSCVAVNSRDPALDFDGSEILTTRRVSSAERGGRGGPTHSGRTAEVGRPYSRFSCRLSARVSSRVSVTLTERRSWRFRKVLVKLGAF